MIAYIGDFWLMLVLTLLVMPLLFLIKPAQRGKAADAHAVMD
jgi:DHA2 family multidrug resistance protein